MENFYGKDFYYGRSRYGHNTAFKDRKELLAKGCKSMSAFDSKDMRMLQKFLIKNKLSDEEILKKLTLTKLHVFIKSFEPYKILKNEYGKHIGYYSIPGILTNNLHLQYCDMKSRRELNLEAIRRLENICMNDNHIKVQRTKNYENVALIKYIDEEKEIFSHARVYPNKFILGEIIDGVFIGSRKSKSRRNAEIIEYVKGVK